MHMLALPIARRELLVLSRAAGTWQHRFVASVAVFGFGIVFALIYHYAGQRALGQAMHFLGGGLSLMCLFTGVALTADSIAAEKREGTLGLLFLTNLSSFEIVLGKLVAYAVQGFYTVLCALPLLSMTMIFGGMPLRDVVLYVISALNLFFFSAAVGLAASSFCREKKRASALGSLIVLFFWFGLPLLAATLPLIGAPQWLIDTLMRFSINLPASIGLGLRGLMPSTSSTAWSMAWTHILTWLLIGLTVWVLPRRWEEEPSRKRRVWREVWKAISLGRPKTRLKLRRRLLDRNAFMWLASRDRLQTAGVWIIVLSMLTALVFGTFAGAGQPGLLIGIGVAISGVLQFVFSGAAGAQLLREYEQGTLELVLATPFSAPEVVRGQFAAARRQYRTLFALAFLLLWTGLILLFWQGGRQRALGITVVAVYSGLFLLNFYALGWVGMWSIVKAPDPKKAHSNAFFFIAILPGLIFGMILSFVQFLNWLTGMSISAGPEVLITLFFLLAFGNCIYWLLRAKRELPHELRLFAFRRYTAEERLTLFGQIGRLVGRWFQRARTPAKRFS